MSELVPHVAPMLAVEALREWEPGRARASALVRATSPLAHRGFVDGCALLEYMAQTVAACLGYEAYRGGDGVRVGMVIACRRMVVHRARIDVGEALDLRVARVRGSDFVSHFDGTVHIGAELVAEATMTLVHGDAPPE